MTYPGNTALSRRRPWPYDAYLNEVRLILEPDADGNLVSSKVKTLDQTAPVVYEYSSSNPYQERTVLFTKLFGGYGQAVEPEGRVRRYHYSTKADCSLDGLWMKGPKFENHVANATCSGSHVVTLTGAGEVRQIIRGLHSGTETVFAICENAVWRRVDDVTWTLSLPEAALDAVVAGTKLNQAVRFKGRHAGAIDALYVSTNTGVLWQYNHLTGNWTSAYNADETLGVHARYIEKVNDELWTAGQYGIKKVEANPLTFADYAGIIWIGDQSREITWLKSISDTLYIFKMNGIFTITVTGEDVELFSSLRTHYNANNGKNAVTFLDRLWIPYGSQSYFLDPQGNLLPDGVQQLLENKSEVKGTMVAGASHNTWFLYEVYCDLASARTYLVKHGSWIDDTPDKGSAQYAEAHHGAIYDWSKRATSCEVVPEIHNSGNDRLYLGFANETIEWTVLPRYTPNPMNDAACEFTSYDSYVYLPIHHSNFRADNKLLHGVSVFGDHLTPSEWIEVEYKFDVVNSAASWTLLNLVQPKFTVPGERKNFNPLDPIYSTSMAFRVKLMKAADVVTSPLQFSPVVDGIGIHESIRPAVSLEYQMTIKASSFNAKRNGTIDRRRGIVIRDRLFETIAVIGPVEFILPNGRAEEVIVTDFREIAASTQKRRDLEWLIQITAMQLDRITAGALVSGITYTTLEGYTLAQLEDVL